MSTAQVMNTSPSPSREEVFGQTEMELQALIERALQAQWNNFENALACQIDALRDFLVGTHGQGPNPNVKAPKRSATAVHELVGSFANNDEWKPCEVPLTTVEPILPDLANVHDLADEVSRVNQRVTVNTEPGATDDTAQEKQTGEAIEDRAQKSQMDAVVLYLKNLHSHTIEWAEEYPMAYIQRFKKGPHTFESFVAGPIFVTISSSAILANAIYIGFEANQNMTKEFERLQEGGHPSVNPVGEYFFTFFFLVELFMRLFAQKWDWLLGKDKFWNFFDAFLVLLQFGSNLSVFRVLRVLRFCRLLKTVHCISSLESLRLMLYGIVRCVVPLFWATMLLILIMYIFSVFFMSCIVGYLQEEAHVRDTELLNGLDEKFGTVFKAMCVLFEGISGGNDWSELAKELKTIGNGYYLCFALYIVFITLGILNIVTGVFVDGTIQASAGEKDLMLKAVQERRNAMVEMIGDLFQQLDTDHSGKISCEELDSHLFDENLREYLCELEMEPAEAKDLFRMLDINSTGRVNIEDFTNGCLKLTGTPKNIDIYTCLLQTKRIIDLVENLTMFLKEASDRTRYPIEWL